MGNQIERLIRSKKSEFFCAYIRFISNHIDIQLLYVCVFENSFQMKCSFATDIFTQSDLSCIVRLEIFIKKWENGSICQQTWFPKKWGYLVFTYIVCMLNRLVFNYCIKLAQTTQANSTYCDGLNKSWSNRNQNALHHKNRLYNSCWI